MEIISHFAASFAQDEPVKLEGVEIGTLDVSAVYGKDYRILEGDYIEEADVTNAS